MRDAPRRAGARVDGGLRAPAWAACAARERRWVRAAGTDTLGAHIGRNVRQAQRLAAIVEAHPELELLAPVPLNIVNFRFAPRGADAGTLDGINREVLAQLQEQGIAAPSGTVVRDRFAIRVAITNHRSNDGDFDALVDGVVRLGRAAIEA